MRPILAGFVLAVAGCGVDLPPPAPDSVVPSYGYNGAETFVSIGGKHFYPQVEVDASNRGLTDVDASFRAQLERADDTFQLTGVALTDYHHLDAVVPSGIPPGTWDLVVTSPNGDVGRLPGAFEVTDTLADRIVVTPGEVALEVFETAYVQVELVDPEGERVLEALDVVVEIEADDGDAGIAFVEGSLSGQVPTDEGTGIRGRLGNDGQALIGVTLSTADTVSLTVSPQNARSGIAEGTQKLVWEPGSAVGLEFTLPGPAPLRVVAGEPFTVKLRLVDSHGVTVETPTNVVLGDKCGRLVAAAEVVGETNVEVTLTQEEPDGCLENRLVYAQGEGESGVIDVVPAALHHFDVTIGDGLVVTAGDEMFAVVVPADVYGNPRGDVGARLEVDDSVGGISVHSCNPIDKSYLCNAIPVIAAEDLTLRVIGDSGIEGESTDTFDVIASAPTDVEIEVAADPVTAGEPVTVTVTLTDAWGNVIDGSTIPSASYLFAGDEGPVSCAQSGLAASGAAEFDCRLTVASPSDALEVSLPSLGVFGASSPFQVVNGALASVQVTPAATLITAGQPLSIQFVGFDAFGNPYVVKPDPFVDVTDASETLSITSVKLEGTGTAAAVGTFTLAGPTVVIASQGGDELGRSAPISVRAAGAAGLEVSLDAPWVWVDAPVEVAVRAVDAFGNPTEYDGVATVSARSGSSATTLAALADGVGAATMTWTDPEAEEILEASAAGLVGESPPFLVVEDCGASGPAAAVSFAGLDEAVVCFDEAAGAPFVASMAGSTGSIVEYLVAVEGEAVERSATSSVAVFASGVGHREVLALAVDASWCGSEVVTAAWIGADDGSAVGPLSVSVPFAEIAAGAGTATVSITDATTCTGDPASGASVNVRTDRGEINGAKGTGSGLGVLLDATGSGSCVLDATAVATGGLTTVQAGVGIGQAWGAVEIDITGDSEGPKVWEQDPRGEASGSVSEIVLTFSEPLRAASVVPSSFSVTGPATATIVSTTLTAPDEVTLALSGPIDAGMGTWTVTALSTSSAGVRDEAGNRLDGDWTASRTTYTGTFGAVPPAVDAVTACVPNRLVFRPDGDDGPGREADLVDVALTSATAPVWWVISVSSAEGEVVHREFVVPISASDTWSWDGRGVDERVVDDGPWTIHVDSDDGSGNRGGGCTTTVTVDNGSGG